MFAREPLVVSRMSASELPPLLADPEYCVVSRRHDSLDRRRRWSAFALLTAISVVVAASFAIVGAWPVLPYSALELVGLAAAFLIVERRARDWERLTVAGDRVIVERAVNGEVRTREFNRRWLRVEMNVRARSRDPSLTLRFAGEPVEFGAALAPDRRIEVATALKRLVAASR